MLSWGFAKTADPSEPRVAPLATPHPAEVLATVTGPIECCATHEYEKVNAADTVVEPAESTETTESAVVPSVEEPEAVPAEPTEAPPADAVDETEVRPPPPAPPIPEAAVSVPLVDIGVIVHSILTASKAAEAAAASAAATTERANAMKIESLEDAMRQASNNIADGVREAFKLTLLETSEQTRAHAVACAEQAAETAMQSFEKRAIVSISKSLTSKVDQLVAEALDKHVERAFSPMLQPAIEAAIEKHVSPAVQSAFETSAADLATRVSTEASAAVTAVANASFPKPPPISAIQLDAELDAELGKLLKPSPTPSPAPAEVAEVVKPHVVLAKVAPVDAVLHLGASPSLPPPPSLADIGPDGAYVKREGVMTERARVRRNRD